MKKGTKCVHIDRGVDEQTGAVNPPIYQSSAFAYSNPEQLEKVFKGQDFGYVYSRISNPTITEFERRISNLESAFGTVAVSSGLAAIFITCLVLGESAGNIVVSESLFGGSRDLFDDTIPRLGLEVRFVDISDIAAVQSAVNQDTVAIFSEIISNPKLVVPNIQSLKELSTSNGIPLIIDATLTSSVGFDAKAQGVDVVIYSSTKLFVANGGAVGGLVVDTGNFDWRQSKQAAIQASAKQVHRFAFIQQLRHHGLNNIGINTSPMNAYVTMQGIETLQLRYDRICQNAEAITDFFKAEGVRVNYPGSPDHGQYAIAKEILVNGFGPLLTIDLDSKERAFQFISRLKIAKNMSNLGDNRTMVIHPKSTIYVKHNDDQLRQAGVTDGLIRINVGIEDVEDLIQEFKEALS